ncbi:MAG: diaminopimelate epimerase [Bacteroidetes bacterium]|nr:diaminopimelate epimerase [Bacteroidota bacterium]
METINFVKYQASGNDFVLIDNRFKEYSFTEEQIQKICHRHFGIGSDGLILLENSKEADFLMKFFNPDGSSDMMCGNGGRSIVAFAKSLLIIDKEASFIAPDGLHSAQIISQEENHSLVKLSLRDVNEVSLYDDGQYLNTGTSHFVKEVDDVSQINIKEEGKAIRYDKRFEKFKGTNANFIQVVNNGELRIRTYERGVEDETLSCGTGITASAIAYAEKYKLNQSPITIHSKGGELKVFFEKTAQNTYSNIFLQGSVEKVFDGVINL